MSKRDVQLLLNDILEATQKIHRYTADLNYNQFSNDEKTSDAVIRNFQIIGEAIGRIPQEFKRVNAHIPWSKIKALRNRIIHEYFGVHLDELWQIIQNNIPELIENVKALKKKEIKEEKKSSNRLSKRNAIITETSGTTVLINYSKEAKKLEVEFKGGRVYHYLNVEPEKWGEYRSWVKEGRSSGEFINKYIKPFYDVVEVED
ncbi:MAG: DUF86 domain-containing protein [Chitinophagaceae bacterium]|nr:DUF86 domain-containing protein [Chitinophagaceae bacterium]